MLRADRISLALLLTLALLAIAGPAAAHAPTPAASVTAILPVAEAPEPIPILTAAPAAPTLSWYLPAALALAALIAWRGPRRAVIVTLVLLLCVFAFEDALHSVHHGFDSQQREACAVAAASANLTAVQVDDPGLSSLVLPVVGPPVADPATSGPTRFLSPDQGRAPPSATL
jgi:fumarate reductase subunit D